MSDTFSAEPPRPAGAESEGSSPETEIDLGPIASSSDQDFELDFGGSFDSGRAGDDIDINLDFGGAESSDTDADDFDIDLDGGEDEAEDDADEDQADPAAEALAQFREELRGKLGEWYVVHTYSGMENRVLQNLENRVRSLNMEDYIFEMVVPTEEVTEIRNGQKKQIRRTVLPGYVLVRMDLTDEAWSTVRHTPSVTGFVGHSNQPVPLSLDEVEKMLAPSVVAAATAASGAPARRKRKVEVADFTAGDSVMVVDGPFAGVHATITEINANSHRIKALVEILGRETPVDLTFAQVQKV